MQFFASCPLGVADLTAAELRACGATQTAEFKLGVQFEGPLEAAYRACLWSRTASRILMPLGRFDAATPEALYQGVKTIPWHEHIAAGRTLAVDFGGSSSGITHTKFGALKTKDAIVDQLRDRTGERPSVRLDQPDVRVDVRLDNERATVSLDLSGESLHRRGYRARGVAAPLKENLAAAILLRSAWPPIAAEGGSLVDPMCGSGTLPIEAAMMVLDIAPGALRDYFGFLGWAGHDALLWQRLLLEAKERRAAGAGRKLDIRGYDSDPGAVRASHENLERIQLHQIVHIERRELSQLTREGGDRGLLITNPPYGERIGDQDRLRDLYALLGQRLREQFEGWKAAVFTGNPPLAKSLSINARRTHTLFNGRIECRLLRFDVEPMQYTGAASIQTSEERREEIVARPGAQMFANRLRKNLKAAVSWARRESIDCYRIYDADMPEYAFAIDLYSDGATQQWAYVQEYAPPRTVEISAAGKRRNEVLAVIPDVLQLPPERIHLRERRQQKGATQYEKVDAAGEFHVVREGPYRFRVNFQDYLDTGLFLDHRMTRARIGELARGKRVLNLFAYTGTATVYAAGGGATSSTTVDMSRTYIEWAKRNLALNQLATPEHGFIQDDCLSWLREQRAGPSFDLGRFDLMFIDPPTHSRSKRMDEDFDVQRDHAQLIHDAAALLGADGLIVFSNNFTRFKMDPAVLNDFHVEDITQQTLPWDFRRNRRIHTCFLIRHKSV